MLNLTGSQSLPKVKFSECGNFLEVAIYLKALEPCTVNEGVVIISGIYECKNGVVEPRTWPSSWRSVEEREEGL